MDAEELRRLRKQNAAREDLQRLGWYHAFRFEDGTEFPGVLPVEVSQHRYSLFPIPHDLTGKRLLDIGAWDGWFSFEAERHGAEVTALDMVKVENFHIAHRKSGSKAKYIECDLFEIPQMGLGKFDYVFFLGVLYHTKYPLLALEIVCGLTLEVAIVESYVTDAADWREHREEIPVLEFYEADELGGQLDNWCGPTVGCLIAMCRAAGFARVEMLETANNRCALACYRKWETAEPAAGAQTKLRSVTNTIQDGHQLSGNPGRVPDLVVRVRWRGIGSEPGAAAGGLVWRACDVRECGFRRAMVSEFASAAGAQGGLA